MTELLIAIADDADDLRLTATARRIADLTNLQPVHWHAEDTDPDGVAAALARAAEPERVGAVLMGGGWQAEDQAVGATTRAFVPQAPKPVFVLPRDAAAGRRIRRVLLPFDATEQAAAAVRRTLELASAAGLELVVLHVEPEEHPPAFSDQVQHEHHAWAHEFRERFVPQGAGDARVLRSVGDPPSDVLAAVRRERADLLVLAWRGATGPRRAAVVRAALSGSPVPVLLVREVSAP